MVKACNNRGHIDRIFEISQATMSPNQFEGGKQATPIY